MKLTRHIFHEEDFQRFVDGDEKAYRKAFDYFFPIVLRYAYSKCKHLEDAEEIAQEAFTQLYLNRHKIHSESDLYPYLFTITKRLCISHYRQQLSNSSRLSAAQLEWTSISCVTEEQIDFTELYRILEQIVATLPAQQQEVYRLSKMEDLAQQEIAEQLNISRHTVKNHLLLATKMVRLQLQKIYFFLF
ncbi:sigma-70 family RNA polymerase sigma factor [Sphingobacterium sp. SGG-5]|uniref:RNA polymerase sigma factor n=1 Tax=Sphingobacterium sp. SGG-5 TaxID=2710881 RepID=UPI0013E9D895|nr:sigma-70 family RNA polymerase sigma factor [Sphingobacterium sp. SGG-5]NGM60301.1 sigma-70 family RNA polymerase sigma factor [Sphingobacterium sp. SGG-5]